ncbi:MAG TPA: hypothetical protein VM554_12235 [Acidisarcina sp.]|nr:hypothetical protein [Acidisarcina sp.]
MRSRWQMETGHLAWHWSMPGSEPGQRVPYHPRWMQESSSIPSSYVQAIPDFASYSPFRGVFWFYPHGVDRDSE